jgi:hypothetical protein
MRRHRLTFDANPKELASREAAGAEVVLLWSRRANRAAVVVEDGVTGEVVEMEVRENESALDVYEHALAYLPTRAFPGRTRKSRSRPKPEPDAGTEPDLLPAA